MQTQQAALRELMREVGAIVRPLGFRGSSRNWRRTTPYATGLIYRQAAHKTHPNTVAFYLRATVLPATVWEYIQWRWSFSHPERPMQSLDKADAEQHGMGLAGDEFLPGTSNVNHAWEIGLDFSTGLNTAY